MLAWSAPSWAKNMEAAGHHESAALEQAYGSDPPPDIPEVEETLRPPQLSKPGKSAVAVRPAATANSAQMMEALRTVAAPEIPCADRTVSWTRRCDEAGYPGDYTGAIRGETRIVCAAGEARETWLNNICAPRAVEAAQQDEDLRSVFDDADSPVPGVRCGQAAGVAAASAPAAALCAQGTPGAVTGRGPWRWVCADASGQDKVVCRAPAAVPAACGTAQQRSFSAAPRRELCKQGFASAATGSGPWAWTCDSGVGGTQVACVAQRARGDDIVPAAAVKKTAQAKAVRKPAKKAKPPRRKKSARIEIWYDVLKAENPQRLIEEAVGLSGQDEKPTETVNPVAAVAPVARPQPKIKAKPQTQTAMQAAPAIKAQPHPQSQAVMRSAPEVPVLGVLFARDLAKPEEPLRAGKIAAAANAPLLPLPSRADYLVTPQLSASALPLLSMHDAAPPIAAALQVPKLGAPLPPSHDPAPGVSRYVPAPPIRASSIVRPRPGVIQAADAEPVSFDFENGSDLIDEKAQRIIAIWGRRLADNAEAGMTVTAYADLKTSDGSDARAARRLSLARALAVRDLLLAAGAESGQVKIRALGANIQGGDPDRVDLSNQ